MAEPTPPARLPLVYRAARGTVLVLIRFYQVSLGPYLGGRCRFHPSCSVYATEAFQTHPPIRALCLTLRRVGRCHPLGGSGFDPVPPPEEPTFSQNNRP